MPKGLPWLRALKMPWRKIRVCDGRRNDRGADNGCHQERVLRQNHSNDVGRQYRFASGPSCQASKSKQQKQEILGFEFGDSAAIFPKETWREKRQEDKGNDTDGDENHRSQRERSEY